MGNAGCGLSRAEGQPVPRCALTAALLLLLLLLLLLRLIVTNTPVLQSSMLTFRSASGRGAAALITGRLHGASSLRTADPY